MARYIVQHRLVHGEKNEVPRTYEIGETFESDDEALVASLRKARALLLPNEVEAAEDVARRQSELEQENLRLQQELEALRAQAAQTKSARGAGAAAREKAPEAAAAE